jgi:hypothetical protein
MPAKPSPKSQRSQPAHEAVAIRAYRLWEQRGGQAGQDEENWFDAERELRAIQPSAMQAQPIDYSELGIQPDPRI